MIEHLENPAEFGEDGDLIAISYEYSEEEARARIKQYLIDAVGIDDFNDWYGERFDQYTLSTGYCLEAKYTEEYGDDYEYILVVGGKYKDHPNLFEVWRMDLY